MNRGHKPSKKEPKMSLITAQGKRSSAISAICRVASAVGVGCALAVAAQILADYMGGVAPVHSYTIAALCAVIFAACAAGADVLVGGVGARQEESRLRRRILTAYYEGGVRRDSRSGTQPSDIVTLMTDNAERLTEFRIAFLGTTVAAIIVPFLALGYIACVISPLIGVILFVSYPLVPLFVHGFMKLFARRSNESRKERGILDGQYLDAIRNLSVIRLLGAGERVEARLREQGERNRGAIMRILAGNQIVIIILDGAVGLLWICLSVLLAYWRLSVGAISLADALTVVFFIVLLIEPIVQVAGFFYVGMGGLAAGRNIKKFLRASERRAPAVSGVPATSGVAGASESSAETSAPCSAERRLPLPHSDAPYSALAVTNLSFGYDEDEALVLRDLSLNVRQGERVGIVGRSGGGKTTFLSLLSGDLRVEKAGAVQISGVDVAHVGVREVRALTAVVAQRTWLFSGTIASNLRIAQPDASDDELWAALERAHLADDVRRMPEGLDTNVGERGQFLSGGQAQRISIAQAFLSHRRIWLLDEPTAHVDAVSEEQIIAALAELPSDITLIVSTHRPGLLAVADRVYELADGRMQEIDSAQALERVEADR